MGEGAKVLRRERLKVRVYGEGGEEDFWGRVGGDIGGWSPELFSLFFFGW
jgi:hypothetical protein